MKIKKRKNECVKKPMEKNNKIILTVLITIIITLSLSGCLDFLTTTDNIIRYQEYPTKISYTIKYGYKINITGEGKYNINYDCDKPEVIIGNCSNRLLYPYDFNNTTKAHNEFITWNITGNSHNSYELGILATVETETLLVSDLNGEKTLTIDEIKKQYPNLIKQYCHKQSNETKTFINPDNPEIKNKALEIYQKSNTNNSFIIAKELFTWLKQHTSYKTHTNNNIIQDAYETFKKGTGDCDDLSYLYISLCRSLNIPARFIRGFLIDEKNATSHAWVEVFVGGNIGDNGWIPVECAGTSNNIENEIYQNFGVETADHLRLFKDDGSNESIIVSISGISYKADKKIHITIQPITEVNNYLILQSRQLTIDKNNNIRSLQP